MKELFPPKDIRQPSGRARLVATYDYRDEGGNLLYQVLRYHPKDFRQRRPDGEGGWSWSVKGVPRVPYRRDINPSPMPDATRQAYRDVVRALCETPLEDSPQHLRLAGDALDRLHQRQILAAALDCEVGVQLRGRVVAIFVRGKDDQVLIRFEYIGRKLPPGQVVGLIGQVPAVTFARFAAIVDRMCLFPALGRQGRLSQLCRIIGRLKAVVLTRGTQDAGEPPLAYLLCLSGWIQSASWGQQKSATPRWERR